MRAVFQHSGGRTKSTSGVTPVTSELVPLRKAPNTHAAALRRRSLIVQASEPTGMAAQPPFPRFTIEYSPVSLFKAYTHAGMPHALTQSQGAKTLLNGCRVGAAAGPHTHLASTRNFNATNQTSAAHLHGSGGVGSAAVVHVAAVEVCVPELAVVQHLGQGVAQGVAPPEGHGEAGGLHATIDQTTDLSHQGLTSGPAWGRGDPGVVAV
mmetsp:Transcript_20124/g.43839  ORF Transcript_20124/g.43839 Transcript_20124/m.43839 type:complete len:209 (+) Transcript_20124:126-752(+)